MTGDGQYVLVGVARARERWSSDLARWATSGAAPIEFVKCLTADEANAVLGTGRRASALLLDARGPGIDRDLIATAADLGTPTIVVSDRSVHRDWDALGCAAVVDHELDPATLLEVLARHTVPVDRSRRPGRSAIGGPPQGRRGRVLAVVGPGGTGASTAAMALAQGLADHSDHSVVLVDGARRGDVAMYHHIGDVIPGLPELVEAHRSDRLDPEAVRRLTFDVPGRGYSVLLGRRRVAEWVTLRRRSVDASIEALTRSFDTVVVDLDADLDGQADTGSPDVDDRHAVALSTLELADAVLVVGRHGLHGLHAVAGLIDELVDSGVPDHRIVPVFMAAPRSPAARAAATAALVRLVDSAPDASGTDDGPSTLHPPLHLRRIRGLDDLHDRVARLPLALSQPLERAVTRILLRAGGRPLHGRADQRVLPGELAMQLVQDDGRSNVA